VARRRPDRQRRGGAAGAVPRDHQGRGAGGAGASPGHRSSQGGRPAGPACAGPAGRLQGVAAPVEEHQDRPVGGTRPDRRPAPDLRARGGDPPLRAAGVLDHRGRSREGRPGVPGAPPQGRGPQARRAHRGGGAGHRRRGAGAPVRRGGGGARREAPQGARPVHDQHHATGSGQAAGVLGGADDAGRAAAIRRRGDRRRGARGADHLHAHRLGAGRRQRGRPGAGIHRRQLRREVPAGRAQRVQERPRWEQGAGRPRGHPPHGRVAAAGSAQEAPPDRPVQALPAGVAALRRLPDEPGDLRGDEGRLHRGPLRVTTRRTSPKKARRSTTWPRSPCSRPATA